MKNLTIEEKLLLLDESLIGIWRFRQPGKKPLWCATFVFNGFYYDVEGYKDISDTLDAAYKKIMMLTQKRPYSNGRKTKVVEYDR